MKKTLAGIGVLMVLAIAGTGCENRKALDEAVSRANSAASRAEQAASMASSSVAKAEEACAHCGR